MLTIIEKCSISAPANTVGERSLPLTFFDLIWLLLPPVHQLFFYDFPHSKSHFIDTIIPNLKHSLSITLQHFFPFACNLVVFSSETNVRKPELRHVEGDSVALTFSECDDLDFHDLKSNHPRDCNKFHPLVPQLGNAFKASSGFVKLPVFSIQVTIFPNSGLTIGLTNHHSLCDASTRHQFLMAWASIAKHGNDELLLASKTLPFYDRVIEYPNSLDEIIIFPPIRTLDENYNVPRLVPQTDVVRSTIVLTRTQINWLKKWLLVQRPTLKYVSSFVVACGFVWSCIAKSRVLIKGKKGEYEAERFGCVADWRARFDPPLPQTYFGNCGRFCVAITKTTLITGSNGFTNAVELLGTAIMEAVNNKQGVLKDATTWLKKAFSQVPAIGVAGTPKHNVYDVDFGWGRPKKYETISLDFGDSISVNASNESSEDLEVGLCLPAKQMDAFITIYGRELKSILSYHF